MEMQGFKDKKNNQMSSNNRPRPFPFKIFVCKYCGKRFLNGQALGGHQNAHKKERQEAQDLQREMGYSMTMMPSFAAVPMVVPCAFIQPHGGAHAHAHHQFTTDHYRPSFPRNSAAINSPMCNYWPGSYYYSLDAGTSNSHVPAEEDLITNNNQLQADVADDVGAQLQDEGSACNYYDQSGIELEVPDLNLDPPL